MNGKVRIGIDKNNSIKLELYLLNIFAEFFDLKSYENDKRLINSKVRKLYYYVRDNYPNSSLSIVENLKKHIVLSKLEMINDENYYLKVQLDKLAKSQNISDNSQYLDSDFLDFLQSDLKPL